MLQGLRSVGARCREQWRELALRSQTVIGRVFVEPPASLLQFVAHFRFQEMMVIHGHFGIEVIPQFHRRAWITRHESPDVSEPLINPPVQAIGVANVKRAEQRSAICRALAQLFE